MSLIQLPPIASPDEIRAWDIIDAPRAHSLEDLCWALSVVHVKGRDADDRKLALAGLILNERRPEDTAPRLILDTLIFAIFAVGGIFLFQFFG